MLEKGKISPMQAAMVLYPVIMSTAMVMGPSIMAKRALQDMWLTPVWASIAGLLAVWLAFQLHSRYPNMSVIEQSVQIAGTVPGKIIGLFYVYILLQINGFTVREYAEFIAFFLQETPLTVVSAVFVMVCAFAAYGGIEVIGRAGQFFFPFMVVPFLVMILLVMKDMEPQNILPIMENGLLPTLRAAVLPQGWFSEVFLISFFLPFVSSEQKAKRVLILMLCACVLTMVIANLTTLFLMGDSSIAMLFPLMDIARYISVASFFENLESGVMAILVIGVFIKVSIFYYATALAVAQWLQLSDYRVTVIPVGWMTVLFSFWGIANFSTVSEWNNLTIPFYLAFSFVIIPAVLLLLSVVLQRRSSAKRGEAG